MVSFSLPCFHSPRSLWGPLLAALVVAAGCAPELDSPDTAEPAEDPGPAPQHEVDRSHVVNCGGELSEPRVLLSWSSAAAPGVSTVPVGQAWMLEVRNTASVPVEIAVMAELRERGVERRLPIAHLALEGGASRRIAVEPAAFGQEIGRGESDSHLAVWAEVRDVRGVIVETAHAPGRWLHAVGATGELAVYDAETRKQRYRKGDIGGRAADELIRNPLVRSVELHDEAARAAATPIQGEEQ